MNADETLKNRLTDNYSKEYDTGSFRNFIPMCGHLGKKYTCHHFFDSHQIIILPTLKTFEFEIISLHEDSATLDGKIFCLTYVPYLRGLAARAKLALLRYNYDQTRCGGLDDRIDFSDASSNRLHSFDDEGEDNTFSDPVDGDVFQNDGLIKESVLDDVELDVSSPPSPVVIGMHYYFSSFSLV